MRKIALRTCRLSQRAAVAIAIAYDLAFEIRPVTLDYTVCTCAKNDTCMVIVIKYYSNLSVELPKFYSVYLAHKAI